MKRTRELRLDQRFDLIVLTGHAFQVFLTEKDQRAVISPIAEHLALNGRFIFNTRNPAPKAWLNWSPERSKRTLIRPGLGKIEAWNNSTHDNAGGIVAYETNYRVVSSQRRFSAVSEIKFTAKEQIEALIDAAGLRVDSWLGDWCGSGYTNSPADIIPIGRPGASHDPAVVMPSDKPPGIP